MQVYHGTIITCNEQNKVNEYLVEDKGKIVYVGDDLPKKYLIVKPIELGDKAIIPSFVDSHLHFASFALFNSGLNVSALKSNEEMINFLSNGLQNDTNKILFAFGASPHSVDEKKLIEKQDLNKVSGTKPIVVIKYDGHTCIVNQAMLDILPEKVRQLRGYNNETGIMNHEAFFATSDFMTSTISTIALVKSMQKAIDTLAEQGIGMINTVSGVGFPKDLDVDLEMYIGKSAMRGFQTRLFFQTMQLKKVIKRNLPRVGGCFKVALDGCFGSEDAAMCENYAHAEHSGILYYEDKEVEDFCIEANQKGLQIEMHAIGDAAFNQGTRAIKKALDIFPREDHRHGIIHACLPTKEGLDICETYKIQLPVQSSFINWPQEPDAYIRELIGSRADAILPLRDMADRGIQISFGSDAPCTLPDPMLWIHNACNHSMIEQSISVEEALKMATYNGYYGTFDEIERGSLEVGKIADMVVLSTNPLRIEVDLLKTIKIEQLILKGKPYKNQNQPIISIFIKGLLLRGRI